MIIQVAKKIPKSEEKIEIFDFFYFSRILREKKYNVLFLKKSETKISMTKKYVSSRFFLATWIMSLES